MKHGQQNLEAAWCDGHVEAITQPVYPQDEPFHVNGEREALQTIVAKLLSFLFKKPWGKTPERRLIVLGIALGIEEMRGRTLSDFAREQNISKKNASEYMRNIRKVFNLECNNFSTASFRSACRKGAKRRWADKH